MKKLISKILKFFTFKEVKMKLYKLDETHQVYLPANATKEEIQKYLH